MFCYTSRFRRAFRPLYNMEAYFRNNCYCFAHQQSTEDKVEENPFMKKYAEKIAALQSSNPEEYKKRIEKPKLKEKFSKPSLDHIPKATVSKDMENIPRACGGPSYSFQKSEKVLNDIVKLDLLKDKTAEEIKNIWNEYHKSKSGLYATLPSEAFKNIISTSQEYRTFLLPVPKVDSYEFVMCQFTGNSCFFTLLVNFQSYKENAPVCLTITYYPELMNEKGIVLMRGEFDEDVLKPHEAQCLSNQLQLYYGGKDARKLELLRTFNKSPDEFRHMDLIAELTVGI